MNISTLSQAVLDEIAFKRKGKGYLRRSEFLVRFSLGMREKTCMTVTVREELFAL